MNATKDAVELIDRIGADFEALAGSVQRAVASGVFEVGGADLRALGRAKLAAEKGALLARRAIQRRD